MKKLLLCLCLSVLFQSVYATPSTIIIVRHGDKLLYPTSKWKDKKNSDYTLDAKGTVRSVKLAEYVLKKFKWVDHVFAPSPKNLENDASSLRPAQTAGPIVSMLANQSPNGYKLELPFSDKQYSELAHLLLTDKKLDHQRILIIWNHNMIPELVNLLGVKEKQPVWPSTDFDSVYLLNYTNKGELSHWQHLSRQYPIDHEITWDSISALGD